MLENFLLKKDPKVGFQNPQYQILIECSISINARRGLEVEYWREGSLLIKFGCARGSVK